MCFADLDYPFPEPGRSATKSGSIFSGGQSVEVTMDVNYPDNYRHTYFRVLNYNRSNITVNSDCSCYKQCEWAKLSCQQVNNHPSCQLNTSQPGIYQFQVKTEHFPCYLDIGGPFNVTDIKNKNSTESDDFKMNFHILSYSLGGLCLIFLIGILATFHLTRRHYKRQRYAQLRKYVDLMYIHVYS